MNWVCKIFGHKEDMYSFQRFIHPANINNPEHIGKQIFIDYTVDKLGLCVRRYWYWEWVRYCRRCDEKLTQEESSPCES